MFVRERVQVPAGPVLVRDQVVTSVDSGALLTAATKALAAGASRVRQGPPAEATPAVSLQARVVTRPERTVVALRAFTAAATEDNQPTLDVNLEIENAGEDATVLMLTGVIRPFGRLAGLGPDGRHDEDLRGVGRRFLDELVALATGAADAPDALAEADVTATPPRVRPPTTG
jgi:hypothetical protein